VAAIRGLARRLASFENVREVDFTGQHEGRWLRTLVRSYLADSGAHRLLFFGSVCADKGQGFLNNLLHNASLLGGLGCEVLAGVWDRVRRDVTFLVPGEELMLRPAFMHSSLCGGEGVEDGLGLAPHYTAFARAWEASLAAGDGWAGLLEHCRAAVAADGGEEGARRRLKAFFVAIVYHDYYRSGRLAEVATLIPLVGGELGGLLALTPFDSRVLRALLSPVDQMLLYGGPSAISQLFVLGGAQAQTDLCIRHALINSLCLFMYAGADDGQPSNFFASCFMAPRSINGAFGLMSTYNYVVNEGCAPL
jgi:hypothetical protein